MTAGGISPILERAAGSGRQAAIDNAASLLARYSGQSNSAHLGEAEAFVRTVEQFWFPELIHFVVDLNEKDSVKLRSNLLELLSELSELAMTVPPR